MEDSVKIWLETFMCGQYANTLESWGYKTLQMVCQLDMRTLQSMGIPFADCNKIVENISVLQQTYNGGQNSSTYTSSYAQQSMYSYNTMTPSNNSYYPSQSGLYNNSGTGPVPSSSSSMEYPPNSSSMLPFSAYSMNQQMGMYPHRYPAPTGGDSHAYQNTKCNMPNQAPPASHSYSNGYQFTSQSHSETSNAFNNSANVHVQSELHPTVSYNKCLVDRNPLSSLEKLSQLPGQKVVDPKSVVNEACLSEGEEESLGQPKNSCNPEPVGSILSSTKGHNDGLSDDLEIPVMHTSISEVIKEALTISEDDKLDATANTSFKAGILSNQPKCKNVEVRCLSPSKAYEKHNSCIKKVLPTESQPICNSHEHQSSTNSSDKKYHASNNGIVQAKSDKGYKLESVTEILNNKHTSTHHAIGRIDEQKCFNTKSLDNNVQESKLDDDIPELASSEKCKQTRCLESTKLKSDAVAFRTQKHQIVTDNTVCIESDGVCLNPSHSIGDLHGKCVNSPGLTKNQPRNTKSMENGDSESIFEMVTKQDHDTLTNVSAEFKSTEKDLKKEKMCDKTAPIEISENCIQSQHVEIINNENQKPTNTNDLVSLKSQETLIEGIQKESQFKCSDISKCSNGKSECQKKYLNNDLLDSESFECRLNENTAEKVENNVNKNIQKTPSKPKSPIDSDNSKSDFGRLQRSGEQGTDNSGSTLHQNTLANQKCKNEDKLSYPSQVYSERSNSTTGSMLNKRDTGDEPVNYEEKEKRQLDGIPSPESDKENMAAFMPAATAKVLVKSGTPVEVMKPKCLLPAAMTKNLCKNTLPHIKCDIIVAPVTSVSFDTPQSAAISCSKEIGDKDNTSLSQNMKSAVKTNGSNNSTMGDSESDFNSSCFNINNLDRKKDLKQEKDTEKKPNGITLSNEVSLVKSNSPDTPYVENKQSNNEGVIVCGMDADHGIVIDSCSNSCASSKDFLDAPDKVSIVVSESDLTPCSSMNSMTALVASVKEDPEKIVCKPSKSRNNQKTKRSTFRDASAYDPSCKPNGSNSRSRAKTNAKVLKGKVDVKKEGKREVRRTLLDCKPVIRIAGPRDTPTSCTVVLDAQAECDNNSKKRGRGDWDRNNRIPSSVSAADIARMSADVPWVCAICRSGCNVNNLGDLFGPYYPKEGYVINSASSSSAPSPKRKRVSKSGKSSPERPQRRKKESQTSCSGVPKEMWVHENCAVWSYGVYIVAGRMMGLEDAILVAQNTVCSACNTVGATLGCLMRGCSQRYHYSCAVDQECKLNEENYSLLCTKHKPKAEVS